MVVMEQAWDITEETVVVKLLVLVLLYCHWKGGGQCDDADLNGEAGWKGVRYETTFCTY